jgi:two-component system phosphate regulon sensor histidine kinase PhoR
VRGFGRLSRVVSLSVLTLVIPLAGGTWALAGFFEAGARREADARLQDSLRRAVDRYAVEVDAAGRRARTLAGTADVQRALARANGPALRRLARMNPGVAFHAGGLVVGEDESRTAARRSIDVVAGKRRIGRVVAAAPLDGDRLTSLRAASRLPEGGMLVVTRGKAVVAGAPRGKVELPGGRADDVEVAGREYRGLAVALFREGSTVRLAALVPKAGVDAIAEQRRERVLVAGTLVLVVFALLGYALAPALARGRLAQQQRAQAARVLSQVGDGVFLVDADDVVRLWNPAAEAVTGLLAHEVVGRPAARAIPGWAAVAHRVPVGGQPSACEPHRRAEAVPLEVGERELWLSISGVASTDGTIYTFRDLTDERRLEKAKIDFVSTVSHELRTPLASIYGAAETLRLRHSQLEPQLAGELVDLIVDQSDRLSRLVEQLLLAGRLDSGRLDIARRSFGAGELARGVLDVHSAALPAGTALELRAPPALPSVLGDPDRVGQVLSNLVENAIKYSPDGGRIEVVLLRRGRNVRFEVRDEGLGIPPAEQGRVFEKFYRLDPEMTRGIGGSGLGLYICRELVRRMDGRIWVRSGVGAGSTFAFELPVADA